MVFDMFVESNILPENQPTLSVFRANPGSEFVVANTLAKWEKFEPNVLGFSQKVVQCTTCLEITRSYFGSQSFLPWNFTKEL